MICAQGPSPLAAAILAGIAVVSITWRVIIRMVATGLMILVMLGLLGLLADLHS